MALMGIREFGRHRGVSHVAVLKALRTGRIRQTPDGLIDSDRADRDWARNTHPAPRAPRLRNTNSYDSGGFSAARTMREVYEARLAKLEYEERIQKLVNADELQVAAFTVERTFKEHMLRVLGRVVPQLAAEADERRVYEILSTAIRTALTEFADQCAGTPQ